MLNSLKYSLSLVPVICFSFNSFTQTCIANIIQPDTTVCPGTPLHLNITLSTNNNNCNVYNLSASLQNGLIGWYPFCGNTNDIGPQQNNGFPTGPLSYTTDRYNNPNTAIKFTGNGESVRTNKIERNTTNSFSYMVWANTSNTVMLPAETINPGSGFGVDLSTSCVIHATHGYNWNLNALHTGAGLYVSQNGVFVLEHTNSVVATPLVWSGQLDGWHAVTIVYENHLPRLYIDGQFIKNGLVTPYTVHPSFGCDSFFVSPNYPYITCGFGKGFNPSVVGVPVVNFKGSIDDIKIYNRALTPAEITELYNKDKYSILWSTGETSTGIDVAPAQPSKFWVKVSDGNISCSDTVYINTKQVITTDTSICPGSTLQLKAASALSYQWSPAAGLSDPAVQNPIFTGGAGNSAATYTLTISNYSNNLVRNGDFEQGNTGFITSYTNCTTSNCLFPLADNGYSVGTDANFFHTFFSGKDHTTGSGNFMIINGARPDLVVWKQTIAVTPNTDYAFGTWISTLIAQNTASIRFSINGVQLGDIFAAPANPNQWVRYFTKWNSGNNTSATIEIVDVFSQASGNDFGLDDIFFGKIVSCTDSVKITVSDSYDRLPDTTKVCTGSVILNAGTGFNSYQWSTGATAQTITVTQPGLYKVKVSRGSCTFSDSTFVSLQPVIAINKKDSICFGQVYMSPTGKNLTTTGIYKDTLRNQDGCDSVIITTSLLVFTPMVNSINKTVCDGSSYTLPSGRSVSTNGIFRDTLKYSFGCDSIITNLTLTVIQTIKKETAAAVCYGQSYTLPSGIQVKEAGLYADTARSVNGCDSMISTTRLTILSNSVSSAVVSLCQGQSYTLSSGKLINNPGIYKDTIQNTSGCDSIITIAITVKPPLTVSLSNSPATCSGDPVTITANASGGNGGPFSYKWSAANSNTDKITISLLSTTIITVSVSDGCTTAPALDTVMLTVNPKPIPAFTVNNEAGCTMLETIFTNNTQPALGNTYRWNFGDGFVSSLANASHVYNNAGSYDVTLFAANATGCADSIKIPGAIKVYNKPQAVFEISPLPSPAGNLKFDFTDRSIGADYWRWDFGDSTGRSTIQNPSYIYRNAGVYTVSLVAGSSPNCTDTVFHPIEIQGYNGTFIPTAFSPNGDGKNDQFKIFGTGIQSAEMQILNRWGEVIFKTTDNPPMWDGRDTKNNKATIPGNYIYVIKIVNRNGKSKLYRGNIVLLK